MVISIYGGSGSGKTTLATALHEGKDTITLRHLEREDGEISSEETDFSGISVLLLEWTHGGSDDLHGVDLSVFLESSPEETKERRHPQKPRRECRKPVYLPCGGTGTGKTRSAAQKCRIDRGKGRKCL